MCVSTVMFTHFLNLLTDNEIDGQCFTELTLPEIKEIIKPLRVVKNIVRVQKEVSPIRLCRHASTL